MDKIIATITNTANLTRNGATTTIVFQTADLLAYFQGLESTSNANITKYTNSKAQLTSESATYDSQISTENTNITNDAALITFLS